MASRKKERDTERQTDMKKKRQNYRMTEIQKYRCGF